MCATVLNVRGEVGHSESGRGGDATVRIGGPSEPSGAIPMTVVGIGSITIRARVLSSDLGTDIPGSPRESGRVVRVPVGFRAGIAFSIEKRGGRPFSVGFGCRSVIIDNDFRTCFRVEMGGNARKTFTHAKNHGQTTLGGWVRLPLARAIYISSTPLVFGGRRPLLTQTQSRLGDGFRRGREGMDRPPSEGTVGGSPLPLPVPHLRLGGPFLEGAMIVREDPA